jgi:hypothetical protein
VDLLEHLLEVHLGASGVAVAALGGALRKEEIAQSPRGPKSQKASDTRTQHYGAANEGEGFDRQTHLAAQGHQEGHRVRAALALKAQLLHGELSVAARANEVSRLVGNQLARTEEREKGATRRWTKSATAGRWQSGHAIRQSRTHLTESRPPRPSAPSVSSSWGAIIEAGSFVQSRQNLGTHTKDRRQSEKAKTVSRGWIAEHLRA